MSWLDRFRPSSRKSADNYPLDLFRAIYGGRLTKSGKVVNWKTAIEVSTVIACARVIAEGLAQVPLKLFLDDGASKFPATDHDLYDLLNLRPNPWQTSFEFFEMLGLHAVLTGNAFCYKNVARGTLVELIPLDPGTVSVIRAPDWTVKYRVTMAGNESHEFSADEIWHIKGPSWQTWIGLDAVTLARDAIGLAIATEESHASLHKNGIQTTGAYSVEGTLDEKQYKALGEFLKKWSSSENAGTPLILDRSAKWISTMMTGVDAQHLETRRYQVEEICRHLRVMPIMVGMESKNSTYASAEQMFLAHVVHTLMPWYRRFEQSISVSLLSEKDRKAGYYPKFIEQGLLRGSLKDTAEYLKGLVLSGIMVPNEARALLEMNPLAGGDKPLVPVNMRNDFAAPEPVADPAAIPAPGA